MMIKKELFQVIRMPLFWWYSGLFLTCFILSFFLFHVLAWLYFPKETLDFEENQDFFSISTWQINNQVEKYNLIVEDYKAAIEKKQKELDQKNIIYFDYFPASAKQEFLWNIWIRSIEEFFDLWVFNQKEFWIHIEFYKEAWNVRGKFKENTIRLYNIWNLPQTELLSVFIHELWHAFDIIYLDKQVFFDVSERFYTLSWEQTKVLRPWLQSQDFITWYAMTSKYEDFAESFTYYILFNNDFRKKAETSKILQKKYDFISKYIFRNDEFKNTNFWFPIYQSEIIWDSTKKRFSLENFFEYLKKWL